MNQQSKLSKYQKPLRGIALLSAMMAMTIRIENGQAELLLHNHPVLLMLLVTLGIFLILVYIKIEKQKLDTLTESIKASSSDNEKDFDSLLKELTPPYLGYSLLDSIAQ